MPASTSQRRTKPKVRRNSDVIADHERYTEEYMTKQAWWINGAYLYSQIKDRL